jgi:hypothetical protein
MLGRTAHAEVLRPILRGGMSLAKREHMRLFARLGYAVHGALYAVVGLLAALAAFSHGGNGAVTDSKGALREVYAQPFGQILLVVAAISLAGYAVWRFVQATLDPEREARRDEHGGIKRVGWLISAVLHSGLVVYAVGLVTNEPMSNGDEAKGLSARVIAWQPWGPWIVGLVGALITGFAIYELHKAWKADFGHKLDMQRLGGSAKHWIVRLSQFGIAARALVFSVIGVFLMIAAVRTDPSQAKGFREALIAIRGWSYGSLIFGLVALGLVAYGLYEIVQARYRRIQIPA